MSFFSSFWSGVETVWADLFGSNQAASRVRIVGDIQTALGVVHAGLVAVEQEGLIGSNDRANIEKAFADAQALCGALTSTSSPTDIAAAMATLNTVIAFMPAGQARTAATVAVSVAGALLPALIAAVNPAPAAPAGAMAAGA